MFSGGLSDKPAVRSQVSGVCDQGACPVPHSLVHEVFVSSTGHEAGGGEGVPLSWLCPLTADRSLEGPGEVCGSGHGLR